MTMLDFKCLSDYDIIKFEVHCITDEAQMLNKIEQHKGNLTEAGIL